jgi:hypothetical protein
MIKGDERNQIQMKGGNTLALVSKHCTARSKLHEEQDRHFKTILSINKQRFDTKGNHIVTSSRKTENLIKKGV